MRTVNEKLSTSWYAYQKVRCYFSTKYKTLDWQKLL